MFNDSEPADARYYTLSKYGPAYKLSPHFQLSEFACKDGTDAVLVHPRLVDLLEAIREHFGRPVLINSGYRTPAHNRRSGGSPNSQHLAGMAADIRVPGVDVEEVARCAERLGAGGVGRYGTFTHVDCGPSRRWRG